MTTSSQSFEQVRSILSKLDRDIQAARARRLNTAPAGRPATPTQPAPARLAPARQPEPAAAPTDEPGRSGYGIARPLRRGD